MLIYKILISYNNICSFTCKNKEQVLINIGAISAKKNLFST